ncbi:MAG: hypothetical protein ACXWW0_12205, partial [Bacteroidia bacterium]
KEETPTPGTNTENPPVTASLICNGTTNTTHFLPLKMGNSWTIDGGVTKTITRDTVINGKKYFVLTAKDANNEVKESYFRSEPKGDIYEYKNYNSNGSENPYTKEYLYLIGDAETAVGYEWDFPGATTATDGKMIRRKISSSNGSAATSKCSYTGLLVMHDYNSAGQILTTYYFKRGLGKVRETVSSTNIDLNAVVIKN